MKYFEGNVIVGVIIECHDKCHSGCQRGFSEADTVVS